MYYWKIITSGFSISQTSQNIYKFYHQYKEIIFLNINQQADILYVQVYHIKSFYGSFLYKA